MKRTKLRVEQFADVRAGGTPATAIGSYWNGEVPWITPKDLAGYEARYISSGERDISEQGLNNSSAMLLPADTVLLSTRAPVGYVALAAAPLATNQGFKNLVCMPGVAVPGFIYYMLKQNVRLLESHATGATFKELSGSRLKAIEFDLPDWDTQTRIADILSAYDDLIENNGRRMALLEEAARQLYREWFVRLRFPGHEHTRIINGAPQAWEPKTLGDLCEEVRETVKPDALKPSTPYIGLEHMPRRSISLSNWGTAEEVTSSKHRFREGEILFGKIRPYFHKVGVAFVDGVASSDAIVIRPLESTLRGFVLMTVSSDPFVAVTAQTMREGSKMPRADWTQMQAFAVPVPPAGLLNSFERVIQSVLEQLKTLTFANQRLRAARDLLLPRLMGGQIAV